MGLEINMSVRLKDQWLVLMLGVLMSWVAYSASSLPEKQEGQSKPAMALTLPPVSDVAISVWANEAIVSVYHYDYSNYQDNLKQAAHYFTSEGWEAFADALSNAKLLQTVKDNKLMVTAVALQPPTMTKHTQANGQLAWMVRMPILVHFESKKVHKQQRLLITLIIVRQQGGVRGLAITHFHAVDLNQASSNKAVDKKAAAPKK